jgi:hypothetical protein
MLDHVARGTVVAIFWGKRGISFVVWIGLDPSKRGQGQDINVVKRGTVDSRWLDA